MTAPPAAPAPPATPAVVDAQHTLASLPGVRAVMVLDTPEDGLNLLVLVAAPDEQTRLAAARWALRHNAETWAVAVGDPETCRTPGAMTIAAHGTGRTDPYPPAQPAPRARTA